MSTQNLPTARNLQPPRRDYGFLGIVTLVAVVAVWLLLLPVVPAIQIATMKRFHLATGSFAGWAIQQPIPSMYNFANRLEAHLPPREPPEAPLWNYTNHFPPRLFTCGYERRNVLRLNKELWLTAESSYRGQQVSTTFNLVPQAGGFQVRRVAVEVKP